MAVTTSLYPLVTFALAVPLLREKLTKPQMAGVILATVSIVHFLFIGALTMHLAPWLSLHDPGAYLFWRRLGFFRNSPRIWFPRSPRWYGSSSVSFCCSLLYIRARAMFHYSGRNIAFVFMAGILNALGSWALLAAMKSGGKASVVVPMTAVYPMVVCIIAPIDSARTHHIHAGFRNCVRLGSHLSAGKLRTRRNRGDKGTS